MAITASEELLIKSIMLHVDAFHLLCNRMKGEVADGFIEMDEQGLLEGQAKWKAIDALHRKVLDLSLNIDE